MIVVGIVIDLTAIGSAWSCAMGADPTLGSDRSVGLIGLQHNGPVISVTGEPAALAARLSPSL